MGSSNSRAVQIHPLVSVNADSCPSTCTCDRQRLKALLQSGAEVVVCNGALAIYSLSQLWTAPRDILRCIAEVMKHDVDIPLSALDCDVASTVAGFDCSSLFTGLVGSARSSHGALLDHLGTHKSNVVEADDDLSEIIRDHLYLSSIGTARNYMKLRHRQISHVINVCKKDDCLDCTGVSYLHLAVDDHSSEQLDFHAAFRFYSDAIEAGGRVLVHCVAGVSRSASVTIAILVLLGVPVEHALPFVRQRRSVIRPNLGFASQLAQLSGQPVGAPALRRYFLYYLDMVFGPLPCSDELLWHSILRADMDLQLALSYVTETMNSRLEPVEMFVHPDDEEGEDE